MLKVPTHSSTSLPSAVNRMIDLMNSENAIKVAADALAKNAIVDVEYWKTLSEVRNRRRVARVVFNFKKQPGVILLPATIVVEVDEETGEAAIIENL